MKSTRRAHEEGLEAWRQDVGGGGGGYNGGLDDDAVKGVTPMSDHARQGDMIAMMMPRLDELDFRPPTREPDVGTGALWRPPPGGCG